MCLGGDGGGGGVGGFSSGACVYVMLVVSVVLVAMCSGGVCGLVAVAICVQVVSVAWATVVVYSGGVV